jgi:DNA-binding NarL/FixJ family response regulator
MMPTMDGFETLRVIRSLAPSLVDMKIIMFSNLHSQEDIDKCMRLGANGFLIKANTTPKEAVELVEKLCTPKTVISLP